MEHIRLHRSLALLKQNAELEYTGEYGAEITTFIPFVAWLKSLGYLEGRRIVTYAGMRPYYFFLNDEEFLDKTDSRIWLPVEKRYWPFNSTYTAVKNPWHIYPNYRKRYAATGRTFKRPVLFIQNKFNVEWDIGPINYIPLRSLWGLLKLTADKFDVVYSRPHGKLAGYSLDHTPFCEYPDRAIIKQFSHVLDFEEECQATGALYNQIKLEMLAKANMFVAVQGGGAHIISCFGNALFLLLHHRESLREREYPHAYSKGAYKYLCSYPSKLLVARDYGVFHKGIGVVGYTTVSDEKIVIPNFAADIVRRLSI